MSDAKQEYVYVNDVLRFVFDNLPKDKKTLFWIFVDAQDFLTKKHPSPREVTEAYESK